MKQYNIKCLVMDNGDVIKGICLNTYQEVDDSMCFFVFEGPDDTLFCSHTIYQKAIAEEHPVRLSSEKRNSLIEYAKSINNCEAVIKLKRELEEKTRQLYNEKERLYRQTELLFGFLPNNLFLSLLNDKLPADIKSKGFYIDWKGGNYVTLRKEQELDKYINEGMYPFVRREYDGCLFLTSNAERNSVYQDIVKKNTGNIIPGLTSSSYLSIGDKNTLSFNQYYKIPYSFGKTQKSIDEIIQIILNE